jgi:murein DD-endopeptidase MepM/ murein hydrolase activator NlpD
MSRIAPILPRRSRSVARHILLGLLLPPVALLAFHVSGKRPQAMALSHAPDAVSKSGCVGPVTDDLDAQGTCPGGVGGPAAEDLADDAWPSLHHEPVSAAKLFATKSGVLELLLAPKVAGADGGHDHDHGLPTLHPVRNARISSHYGPRSDPFGKGRTFHGGIDFAGPLGTPIQSAAAGMVVEAQYQGGYGNVVKIDHGNGHTTVYAHNHKLLVRSGQMVMAGQSIALLGSTGRSTGPHLHFEVRVGGLRVDPRPFLRRG